MDGSTHSHVKKMHFSGFKKGNFNNPIKKTAYRVFCEAELKFRKWHGKDSSIRMSIISKRATTFLQLIKNDLDRIKISCSKFEIENRYKHK